MKALTKASRVNTALQVIQHMNAGMNVVEACHMAGMFAARSITVPYRITDLKRKNIPCSDGRRR
jgi:hypothetical protein